MRVDVSAEVLDCSSGSVQWNEVGKDPADGTESEPGSEIIDYITGTLHQLHRVLCTDLQTD